jgi:hypothetical protein
VNISFTTANIYEDNEKIISLLDENIGVKSKVRYEWMYVNNKMGTPYVILAVDEESKITIGMVSLFPMRFNELDNVWLAGDYFVKKEYRSLFVAIGLQKQLLEYINAIEGTVITFPNSKSEPIIKRLGYEEVYECQRLVKLLNSTKYIESKFNKALSSIVSPLLNVYFKVTSCEYLNRNFKKYAVSEEKNFHKSNVVVIKEENNKYTRTKNIDFLNWKYFDNPFIQYYVFTISKKDNIVGSMVYYFNDGDAVIREVLADEKHKDMLFKLFIKEMREKDIEKVVYYSNRFDTNLGILNKCNFTSRAPLGRYYIYSAANNADFNKKHIMISASDDDM